jgi:NAD(P)-dependent dehydrogenase (short-subunit alcohol dehydrogenase family)
VPASCPRIACLAAAQRAQALQQHHVTHRLPRGQAVEAAVDVVERGPDNIRVNAICPVMGVTALLEQFMGMPDTPENRKKFLATIPLGRLSTPLDIAKAALFLASDDAEFITGVEFPVDGGRTV